MNVRKMAAMRLRELEALEQAVRNLPGEIARLRLAGGSKSQCDALEDRLAAAQLWAETTRQAMQILTPAERLLAERLLICPAKGNVQRLCQELGVEQSAIYRRKDKMLQKMGKAMFGE